MDTFWTALMSQTLLRVLLWLTRILSHFFFWQDDPEAHKKFVRINRAYEVLKDEDLRKVYDLHGEKGLDEGRWGHSC